MKYIALFLCVGCLVGCSSTRHTLEPSPPRLVTHKPLPLLPETIMIPPTNLDLSLLITEDGSVSQVQLLTTSGSTSWDSLATETIRQWRFAPARIKDQPISTWFRMQASVQYSIPYYLSLAEIVCPTMEEADSVYTALKRGRDFGETARRYSIEASRENNGMLGEIDINSYPEKIRQILLRIEADEFTNPLRYGDYYIILKRMSQ